MSAPVRSNRWWRRLRAFLQLSGADRRGLVRALTMTAAVRLGLWVLPYRLVRRLSWRSALGEAGSSSPETVARWTEMAAAVVPGSTCLVKALVGERLLRSVGVDARLRIGAARSPHNEFEAHAWVEVGGRGVLGSDGTRVFHPLTA